jgi:hypothetical protein
MIHVAEILGINAIDNSFSEHFDNLGFGLIWGDHNYQAHFFSHILDSAANAVHHFGRSLIIVLAFLLLIVGAFPFVAFFGTPHFLFERLPIKNE